LDADGEARAEGDLFERKVGILPAGAFHGVDVGGAAGPDFRDDLRLFGREEREGREAREGNPRRGKTCGGR
jgi:hypothetical protein